MAKYCSDDCEQIGGLCDYCKWYDFNGDEQGAYTGDGWCRKLSQDSEPHWSCDEFECFRIK